MSKETIIDLKKHQKTHWIIPSGEKHNFTLLPFKTWFVEAEGQRFHYKSTVFLPDFLSNDDADEKLSGLAILRECYLFAEKNPTNKLLLVAHTDMTGEGSYNADLSQRRADNILHLLEGDKQNWCVNSHQTHQVEDYQRILHWITRSWGISCNPRGIDNKLGPNTKRAIRSFKLWYNQAFNRNLDINSQIDLTLWGAFYDVYLDELSHLLNTDSNGLSEYQTKLVFVNNNCKASGAGKSYPIESSQEEKFRNPNHRRVEILFFEPGDEPITPKKSTANKVPKELDILYASNLYAFNPIIVEPAPQRVWIDLQTVNHFGLYEANIELTLQSGDKPPIKVTTNDQGYWAKRVTVGSKITIRMTDGRPVTLGSDKLTENKHNTAIITAEDVGRSIRDIIVPTLSKDEIAAQETLVKVYKGHKNPSEKSSTKSGLQGNGRETPETLSSRGGVQDNTRRLTLSDHITDNLCIAAGWQKNLDNNFENFLNILDGWIIDRFPTVSNRGYFLQIIVEHGLIVLNPNDKYNYKSFNFESGKGISSALYGAYSPFETSAEVGAGQNVFIDMATQSSGFTSGDLAKIKIANKKFNTENQETNVPKDKSAQGYAETLGELIEKGSTAAYNKLIDTYISDNCVEIAYIFLQKPNLQFYAKEGGTGLLENYVKQSAMRKRIHERNVLVATNVGNAYEAYLANYLEKVNEINPKWQDVKFKGSVIFPKGEHPELRLYKLGAPDSAFRFPCPVGATKDEYRELCALTGRKTIRVWEAITKKLNAIRGEKGDGSIWLEVEFSLEAGELAGPLSGASLKLNFEVNPDDGYQIVSKAEKEIPLTVKAAPDSAGLPANVKYSVKYDEKTERLIHTVEFSIGKYGIEADSTGTVKLKVGMFEQSMNQRTAIVSAGVSVSLRDMVAKSFKGTPPDWVAKLPEVKASAKISVKLLSHGTLLRVISKSPGFFEMRPRREFESLLWHLLSSDEQIYLKVLGWSQNSWDYGIRPDSAKTGFNHLLPDEKYAAMQLPVPVWEEYWLAFWVQFSNMRKVT